MPKIIDHDERRAQIAGAVLRVVARDGVSGVTMRDVAEEAGWSTGVLNHYFDNKRALLVGGLRQASQEAGKNMVRALHSKRGTERVRAVLEEGMPLDARRAALCRIFFFFWAEGISDEAFGEELAAYYDSWRNLVRTAIEQGQGEGEVREQLDAQRLAEMLVALADGLAVQAMFDAKAMSAARTRSHVDEWIGFLDASGPYGSVPSPSRNAKATRSARK